MIELQITEDIWGKEKDMSNNNVVLKEGENKDNASKQQNTEEKNTEAQNTQEKKQKEIMVYETQKKLNKKKKKKKKKKKEIKYLTKDQSRAQVKEIVEQLTTFGLNLKYEPIQKLYKLFKEYINEGNRIVVNIPFPELNRRIKGLLSITEREEGWINLKHEKF